MQCSLERWRLGGRVPSFLGGTGRQEGRKSPTSFQMSSFNRTRCNFSSSKLKSKGRSHLGSSSSWCSCAMKGCFNAPSTVIRFRGLIWSIRASKSKQSGDALGNCLLRGTTGLLGSLRMKRSAFSDVTKSRSSSGSFPSLFVIIVS